MTKVYVITKEISRGTSRFDDLINEFIQNVKVIDIKYQFINSDNYFYQSAMIIYEEKDND